MENRQPHSVGCPRRARNRLPDPEQQVESDLPEWLLQPFTEGLPRGSSSSTDVSPADVVISPPGISLSAHPTAKPTSNRAGGKLNLFTHFPKDPNCEVCRRTLLKIAESFGEKMTADHKVLNEDPKSRMLLQSAVFVQDLATQWSQSYPCKTKSAQEAQRSPRQFSRPEKNQVPVLRTVLMN